MNVELLQKTFLFFNTLTRSDLENFLRFCKPLSLQEGDYLWHEGDSDNFAAFILKGKIGIKKRTDFGGRSVFVGTYGTGSVVGELCLLTTNSRRVAAEAIEDTDTLILESEKFEELIVHHPLIGLSLLRHIFITTSARLTKSYERIASIF